jgi:hypothetical protein
MKTFTNNVGLRVPFQIITNMTFTSIRFQGTHDFEAGPSLDISMTPHLVSHDNKLYCIIFNFILLHTQKKIVLKYAGLRFP